LFSGLQQLAEQDPERFKQVAQQISDQLSATPDSSTGRANVLAQKLAERFGEAAQTGDLSPFRPGGERGGIGHHHHHHHHHHGHDLSGGSEAVRSVLENALDLVHGALTAPAAGTGGTSSGGATGGTTDDAGATGDATSTASGASSASSASPTSDGSSASSANAVSDTSTIATPNPALETAR
jgi:hypothetical protein